MSEAGYDPVALARFFEKLEAQGGPGVPEFLSDHPSPGNRVEAVQAEARTLPHRVYITDLRMSAKNRWVSTCFPGPRGASMEVWFTAQRDARKPLNPALVQALGKLRRLPVAALRHQYQEQFGKPGRSSNKHFLFRRLAWQLQAQAEGGLSERARRRAAEIATDADLRFRTGKGFWSWPAKAKTAAPQNRCRPQRDWRLPEPGTLLSRQYQGQEVVVKVLAEGFEYQAQHYRSLSAIARKVTGTQWNGYLFFDLRLRQEPGRAA